MYNTSIACLKIKKKQKNLALYGLSIFVCSALFSNLMEITSLKDPITTCWGVFCDVETWFLNIALMEFVRQSFSSSAIVAGRCNTGVVL